MTLRTVQKPNIAVRLPADLQEYITRKAAESYRSLTGEITMRLERTRQSDLALMNSDSSEKGDAGNRANGSGIE
jgi:hypothetical protein